MAKSDPGDSDAGSRSTGDASLEIMLGGFHFCPEASLKLLLSHLEVFGAGLRKVHPGWVWEKRAV